MLKIGDKVRLDSEHYGTFGLLKGTEGVIVAIGHKGVDGTYSDVQFPGIAYYVSVYDHQLKLVSEETNTHKQKFVDPETMWKITQSICKGQ
jgi:hypothetical protein